ncbi:RraA family protein [Streptomyces sp. SL13]|uniref:Putative 4-hydroxy-4-methyl-2-oxoglutarate aldolase n=1 Tax=Streptantibioticus silvisoli TaxID=2705255 RepID=A0AA90H9Q8_9ACTN|nr:RraA family protein [Streptantibioticus silvisoli]MDI5973463.1 RraA family protein [Streptantibioticus silvisoli]
MTEPAVTLSPAFASLAARGTAVVSDAMDLLGADGQILGPRRLSGQGPVVGPAFTVQFEPVEPGAKGPAADFLDDVPAGSVVVLAAGAADCTVWGDILAEVAIARGVAGTVIDGMCRDLDGIRELGYSVWAHDAFMRSGKNRVRMTACRQPVVIGRGAEARTVRPGDVVCADGSGVTVVPADRLAQVVETVERIGAMEDLVLKDVRAGVSLREARARHGYNRMALRVAEGG